jgi:predicted Zn-dependent protease
VSEWNQACAEAHGWMERRRWREAEAALQRGLAAEPENLQLLFARARLAFLRDQRDAWACAQEVLQREPEHAGARLLLARIAAERGEPAEAEAQLLELLRESPQDPDLLCFYALLLLRAGQIPKSRQLAVEALRHAPEDAFVLSTLALLDLAEGRRTEDMAALEKMLDLYPESEATLRTLAFALLDRHQLAAAEQAAATLVRRSPNDASVVRLAAAIRYYRHWSMRPLYPMLRWGWAGSFGMYGGFLALTFIGRPLLPPPVYTGLVVLWLVYAVYSWVYPGLLRRARFPELKA